MARLEHRTLESGGQAKRIADHCPIGASMTSPSNWVMFSLLQSQAIVELLPLCLLSNRVWVDPSHLQGLHKS